MSVLIDKHTQVICQGFTGRQGPFRPYRRLPKARQWCAV